MGAIAEDGDCDGALTADDCNDADASLNNDDIDGDTYSSCDGDCDDNDDTLELSDLDSDGYSTCDGDCDDNDDTLELSDLDSDGYSTCDGDCNDAESSVLSCSTNPAGGNMVLLSGGVFDMGCTQAQWDYAFSCENEEKPMRTVTLTHDFYIGETEVTQDEYSQIMGSNPSFNSSCSTCPVEQISWHDAAEFANALSVADGLTECFVCTAGECTTDNDPYTCDGYRLPTEAEWEYAARAGTDLVFAGSDTRGDVAWSEENASASNSVGLLQPNGWGLYDMSGNVFEWVWDWWDQTYYSWGPTADPTGGDYSESWPYRIGRGGGFNVGFKLLRVSHRTGGVPTDTYNFLGMRLVRSIP